PSNWRNSCPLAISHSRAVPYSPPVRTCLPSGEKDTARIASVCPPKICNCWPVDRSQRRVVVSAPAVSACLPSGEKTTTYIASVWPIKRRKLKGAREGAAQCIDRLRVVAILQTADSEQSRQLTSCTAIEGANRFVGQPQTLGSNEVILGVASEDPGRKCGDQREHERPGQ